MLLAQSRQEDIAQLQKLAEFLAWTPSNYVVVVRNVAVPSLERISEHSVAAITEPYYEALKTWTSLRAAPLPSALAVALRPLDITHTLGVTSQVRDVLNDALTKLQIATYEPPPKPPRNKLLIGALAIGAVGILGGLAYAAFRGVRHAD
jgi:hypothetical protein